MTRRLAASSALLLAFAGFLSIIAHAATSSVPGDENWDTRFTRGVGAGDGYGTFHDAILYQGDVIAIGSFASITGPGGVVPASRGIVRFDGTAFSNVGGGLYPGDYYVSPSAVASFQGDIIVFGNRYPTNLNQFEPFAERFDGNGWTSIALPPVWATDAEVFGNDLYVCGSVSGLGVERRVARFDGSSWSSVDGTWNGDLYSLSADASDLYLAGTFTLLPDSVTTAYRVARWDGSQWWPAASQPIGDAVVVKTCPAGVFLGSRGIGNVFFQKSGSMWVKPGGGVDNGLFTSAVGSLAALGSDIYLSGTFNNPYPNLVSWNGSSYSDLDGYPAYGPGLLADPAHGELYAFTGAMDRWDGTGWTANGPSGPVDALEAMGGDVYVGGHFRYVGVQVANNVARWDGSAWSAVGTGTNGEVHALLDDNGTLIAGGDFTTAGGTPAAGLATWNGLAWSALGQGVVGGSVLALASDGTNLYAGGSFVLADGAPALNIARWDGSSWHAVGGGTDGTVRALAMYDGDLYVGGDFLHAGGNLIYDIARWDGSAWSTVQGYIDGPVRALEAGPVSLYVGGAFSYGSGLAKWDGSAWSTLGSGTDGTVRGLSLSGSTLWAVGTFANVDGVPAAQIASWDGTTWSALGSGLSNGSPRAVLATPAITYAVGDFKQAGGKQSYKVAAWNTPATGVGDTPHVAALRLEPNVPNPFNPETTIRYHLDAPGRVTLAIYDVGGRRVRTLVDAVEQPVAGGHAVRWNGTDDAGTPVSSGVYFVRVSRGRQHATLKITLLK